VNSETGDILFLKNFLYRVSKKMKKLMRQLMKANEAKEKPSFIWN